MSCHPGPMRARIGKTAGTPGSVNTCRCGCLDGNQPGSAEHGRNDDEGIEPCSLKDSRRQRSAASVTVHGPGTDAFLQRINLSHEPRKSLRRGFHPQKWVCPPVLPVNGYATGADFVGRVILVEETTDFVAQPGQVLAPDFGVRSVSGTDRLEQGIL